MEVLEKYKDEIASIKKIVTDDIVGTGSALLFNDSAVGRAVGVALSSKIDPVVELFVELLQTRPFSDMNKRIALKLLQRKFKIDDNLLKDNIQELTDCMFESPEERTEYIIDILSKVSPFKCEHSEDIDKCIFCSKELEKDS